VLTCFLIFTVVYGVKPWCGTVGPYPAFSDYVVYLVLFCPPYLTELFYFFKSYTEYKWKRKKQRPM